MIAYRANLTLLSHLGQAPAGGEAPEAFAERVAAQLKNPDYADFVRAVTSARYGRRPLKRADVEMGLRAYRRFAAALSRREREAEARMYEAVKEAEARRAQAEAQRYSMEQEAEGIRARGIAEAEAIEKKAEAQKKMGEASVLEMYLKALPEVVKNAAEPLARTDRIVMYGDGNSTKIVKDVMSSANQIMEGMKESTGIDISSLIAGAVGGRMAASRRDGAQDGEKPEASV